jgi:hypothetical protein
MLLGLYILCWILIVLIIICSSIAIIYQKQQLECLNTTNPWCYRDWYCLNPTLDNPNTENPFEIEDNYIEVNKTTLSGVGDTYPNQPNAGSIISDCTPLTDKTVEEFWYYQRNEDNTYYRDVTGQLNLIMEIPKNKLNACQIPIPGCLNPVTYKKDENGNNTTTVDTSMCSRTTDNYSVGDIFWPACRGGKNSQNKMILDPNTKTMVSAGYNCLIDYN